MKLHLFEISVRILLSAIVGSLFIGCKAKGPEDRVYQAPKQKPAIEHSGSTGNFDSPMNSDSKSETSVANGNGNNLFKKAHDFPEPSTVSSPVQDAHLHERTLPSDFSASSFSGSGDLRSNWNIVQKVEAEACEKRNHTIKENYADLLQSKLDATKAIEESPPEIVLQLLISWDIQLQNDIEFGKDYRKSVRGNFKYATEQIESWRVEVKSQCVIPTTSENITCPNVTEEELDRSLFIYKPVEKTDGQDEPAKPKNSVDEYYKRAWGYLQRSELLCRIGPNRSCKKPSFTDESLRLQAMETFEQVYKMGFVHLQQCEEWLRTRPTETRVEGFRKAEIPKLDK